jgi:hypothetical protein
METRKDIFKLDRTFGKAMTLQEADDYQNDYSGYTLKERLGIVFYLTSRAYNFDANNPPRIDRTVGSAEKLY